MLGLQRTCAKFLFFQQLYCTYRLDFPFFRIFNFPENEKFTKNFPGIPGKFSGFLRDSDNPREILPSLIILSFILIFSIFNLTLGTFKIVLTNSTRVFQLFQQIEEKLFDLTSISSEIFGNSKKIFLSKKNVVLQKCFFYVQMIDINTTETLKNEKKFRDPVINFPGKFKFNFKIPNFAGNFPSRLPGIPTQNRPAFPLKTGVC